MDLEKLWQKALGETEIHRARLEALPAFTSTKLPYTLLAESSVNMGDTVVRRGAVKVDKPLIILPENYPLFDGFDFKEDFKVEDDSLRSFLLMRGITLPSLRYSNLTYSVDVHEDSLKNSIKHYKEELQKKENILEGLVVGPDDVWKFSLLIYVATMVSKSAPSDIKAFLDKLKKDGLEGFSEN